MDMNRLNKLAGIKQEKTEIDRNIMLNEATVIPEDSSIEQVANMFDAGRRALGIVNTIKDPVQKKKHLTAVFTNLNKIRAALERLIKRSDAEINY